MTPASNTNVEPTTYAMLRELDGITAHFSRFPLPPLDRAIDEAFLQAPARLLLEADVDVLIFHGTAGSWTGVDQERIMCERLEAEFGVPTTTATLSTLAALESFERGRTALAFPGPETYARQIQEEYRRRGIEFASVVFMEDVTSNLVIGRFTDQAIEAFVRSAAQPQIDTVVVIGTNLRAAPALAPLEAQLGIVIVDSTAATLWHVLRMLNVHSRPTGWGRILSGEN